MRILLIHSDYLNYNVKKETPVAEEIEDAKKEGSFDDSLVVFTAVEKDDENNPEDTDIVHNPVDTMGGKFRDGYQCGGHRTAGYVLAGCYIRRNG